jgi:CspA family cold shock protein
VSDGSLDRRAVASGTSEEKNMAEGTIKKKTDRGFGFIRTSRGSDLYFHMTGVDGETSFEQLREGQRVSYVEGKGLKGPRAENVKPL